MDLSRAHKHLPDDRLIAKVEAYGLDKPKILSNVFGTRQRNPVKLDRTRKVSTFACFLTAIAKV